MLQNFAELSVVEIAIGDGSLFEQQINILMSEAITESGQNLAKIVLRQIS